MSNTSSIIKKITTWFNQPYPFYYKGKDLIWVLMLVFLLIFCFDFFFRPFNVNYSEHRMGYFWIACIHALIPVMVLAVFWGILKLISVRYEQWTMGREMLFVVILLCFTGVGQWLIRDVIYDNPQNSSLHLLWEEVRHALLVGLMLISVIIPLNLNRLKTRNQNSARLLSGKGTKLADNMKRGVLEVSVKGGEALDLNPAQFLFARSEGNYLEIFQEEGQEVRKNLVRMALKSLDAQLQGCPGIIKVHRSYIVNLSKVVEVNGNAQGYRLKLVNSKEEVPVSRSFTAAFDRQYQ